MKRILGLLVLIAATSANAVESKFGDLNYFLPQGRYNLNADANWQTENQKVGVTKYETEGTRLNTKLAYGYTEVLNLFVGLDYNLDVEVTPEGGNRFNKNGLHNPVVGINYRSRNQAQDDFNLDLGAVINVSIQDEEIGVSDGNDSKKNGNASQRGGLEFNARLGNKWDEANEFYAKAGLVYNQSGQQTQRNIGSADVDSDLDTSMDIFLAGFYQYRPVNELMFTFGAEGRRVGGIEGDTFGDSFEIKSHIDYKLIFDVKYLVTETFIVKWNYTGSRLGSFSRDYDAAADQDFEKRQFMSTGLGIDYLF